MVVGPHRERSLVARDRVLRRKLGQFSDEVESRGVKANLGRLL